MRAWFNALAQHATVARGREAVEKLLQREGKTALKLEDLAAQLGFRSADALFEVVGKDEFSLRNIEALLRPAPSRRADADEIVAQAPARRRRAQGGVLVVGVESLLTSAGALLPAGAARRDRRLRDARQGRRRAPRRLQQLPRRWRARAPERVIAVAWGAPTRRGRRSIRSTSRSRRATARACCATSPRCFAKEKMNVIGVKSQSVTRRGGGTACMTFTVEVADAARLGGDAGAGRAASPACARRAAASGRHFTGIGVARSTGTAVTLFCGEPSITRSE